MLLCVDLATFFNAAKEERVVQKNHGAEFGLNRNGDSEK